MLKEGEGEERGGEEKGEREGEKGEGKGEGRRNKGGWWYDGSWWAGEYRCLVRRASPSSSSPNLVSSSLSPSCSLASC